MQQYNKILIMHIKLMYEYIIELAKRCVLISE